ncbi:hypothetical protein AX16_005834 [Volvariella volvacea WC 439]|nr:hypothetical protein AX16_005834 [Volvariella volvacea WC 439]
MPNLRVLHLDDALPFSETSVYPARITFNHLDQLSISGSDSECFSFFNSTSFLTIHSIEIMNTGPIGTNTYNFFQSWISGVWRIQDHELPLVQLLSIDTDREGTKIIANAHPNYNNPDVRPKVDLDLLSEQAHTQESPMRWSLSFFPLSRCTEFESSHFLTQEEWTLCLDKMPNLESLSLFLESEDDPLFPCFVDVLKISGGYSFEGNDSDTHPLRNVPFPKLKKLKLVYNCSKTGWSALHDVFQDRRGKGYGLYTAQIVVGRSWSADEMTVIKDSMRHIVADFSITQASSD